jgi:L-ascorbate metabolism protein UlaG (beta-lactamase superfamily)
MRITWLGHATVEIEMGGTRLLTDPILRGRVGHLRRIVAAPDVARIERPDAVLVSHAHLDHLDPASLRLLSPCPVIAPRGCGWALRRAGFRDVTEAVDGEPVAVGAVRVTPTRVVHDGRRHPFSRARKAFGYLVDGRATAFFAGDTDVFDAMAALAGRIDAALLPIWGWGPRVGRGHMDPERAARAAALLQPRVAIPIHWGTIASPRAPWLGDPGRPARIFTEEAAKQAPGVEVRVLPPGGSTDVAGVAARGSEPE